MQASTYLKNVYKNDSTVKIGSDITIENNMNMMIDGITIFSTNNNTEYTNPLTSTDADGKTISWPNGKPNPFKKLFPLDSIAKPFRPVSSGITYAVVGSTIGYYFNPKGQLYDSTASRIYYPGATTTYKYWLGPINTNIDLTVRYKQTQTTWEEAIQNGYLPATTGAIPLGNKSALTNKIVVMFEKFHALPKNCTIKVEKEDGTFMTDVVYTLPLDESYAEGGALENWNGVLEFFYNGSTWTTDEPLAYADPILIKSINVKANIKDSSLQQPVEFPRLAVIEVSARCIKKIPVDAVEYMDITKETTSGSSDLLPVGFVNSNTFSGKFSDYNNFNLTFKDYNRYSTSFSTSPTIIYLMKNSKFNVQVKTYHENGLLGSGVNKHDITPQGIFYLDSYSIDEFGSADVQCLDGAKQLMETLCPDILLRSYPVTAILRVLLDNIGFTNYNFNLKFSLVGDESVPTGPDKSVPIINYWWTVENQTVWEAIQNLCRDVQMNAFFDEDNILQFSSRDYIYGQSEATWTFRYDATDYIDNTNPSSPVGRKRLPNILTFNKEEVASANQVKILWSTPLTSNYLSNSTYLWQSPTSFLAAGGLRQKLPDPVARITGASSNGSTTTFTCVNDYSVNQIVNITGLNPTEYNLINAKIIAVTDTSFTVNAAVNKPFVSAGSSKPTATITNATYANGYITYIANNSFIKGEKISISPKTILPITYAIATPVSIAEASSTYFKIASKAKSKPYQSGGTAIGLSYGTATITPESTPLYLNINTIDTYTNYQSIFNYNGYFLIDSEIIEFDAIQYQYIPILKDDGSPNGTLQDGKIVGEDPAKTVWITSSTDISKYRALSKNGYADSDKPETAYFKPTGIYRIKTRGALGTTAAFHNATSDYPANKWTSKQVNWKL